MTDDLTPDAFARLTALEQSQALLRQAEVLNAASLARHEQIVSRHEQDLVLHGQRLAHIDELLAKVQLTLDAVLAMLRDRNGPGGRHD